MFFFVWAICLCDFCEHGYRTASKWQQAASEKWSDCLADLGARRWFVDGVQSAERALKGPNTRLHKPGPPAKHHGKKMLNTVDVLDTLNPRPEASKGALRRHVRLPGFMDDTIMGD